MPGGNSFVRPSDLTFIALMATLCGAIVRVYELGELAMRVQMLEERDEEDDVYPRPRS